MIGSSDVDVEPVRKPSFQHFSGRAECLQQLTVAIAAQLQQTLATHPTASLLLPGRGTPQALLPLLAAQPLPWARCNLSPTDERWVPVGDPQSNLLQLQRGLPAARCLDPRVRDVPEQSASAWGAALQAWLPFSAVLLGMGEDGHCASLFPGMPGLGQALDLTQPPAALVGLAADQPQTRLSLNLSLLLSTRWLGGLWRAQAGADRSGARRYTDQSSVAVTCAAVAVACAAEHLLGALSRYTGGEGSGAGGMVHAA